MAEADMAGRRLPRTPCLTKRWKYHETIIHSITGCALCMLLW